MKLVKNLIGDRVSEVRVDLSYCGHDYDGAATVHVNKRRRRRTPQALWRWTLTVDQVWMFFDDPDIPEHVKVMAHVARLTGLRISKILGLKDKSFDLDKMLFQQQKAAETMGRPQLVVKRKRQA
jgi:integrase